MAIVNNPHNIQDIDKQYKTWVKLGKPTGILIMSSGSWFPSTETYFAREWLEDFLEYSNGLRNKYRTKIESMQYRLKEDYLRNVDFTNTSRFKKVFYTSEDANYTFEIHAYSIEELMGNSDDNGAILNNNGLAELRIYTNGETNPSNVIKITSNDRTDNFRSNDYSREVLPGKFTFCMINPKNEITDIEFDHKYTLDGLVFIVGYGLTGNFINVTQKQSNPRIPSLNGDSEPTENITSTDLLKVPSVTDAYFFTDRSKQRNAICIDNKGASIGNAWLFNANEYKNRNVVDYTLFSNFKLNTEFLTNIIAPFADYVRYNRDTDEWLFNNHSSNNYNAIKNISMHTIRFDNCKIVSGLFYGIPLQTDKFQELINNFDFLGGDKIEEVSALFTEMDTVETLDLSQIIFPINCKKFKYLFHNSNSIKSIKFNTHFKEMVQNVEDFRENFTSCVNLRKIENLSLSMPKCKSYKSLFAYCENLAEVDLSDIQSSDTEATDLSFMFRNCTSLNKPMIDLSGVKYIKSLNDTFSNTLAFTGKIKFSPEALDMTTKTEAQKMDKENGMVYAFYNTNISEIENLDKFKYPELKSLKSTFQNMYKINTIDLSNLTLENVENLTETFSNCHELKTIKVPKAVLSDKLKTMYKTFEYNQKLETLDFPPLTKPNNPQNTTSLTSLSNLFYNCSILKTPIYINNLDTSKVTDLSGAFSFGNRNTRVTPNQIDLNGFEDLNTSNVTNFESAFNVRLKDNKPLDLRRWDVRKGTNFSGVFGGATKINITGWDTSNLVNGFGFFSNTHCSSTLNITGLGGLDFSNLDSGAGYYNESFFSYSKNQIRSEKGGIDYMFASNEYLINFAMPNNLKNLSKITSLFSLFSGCYKLTTINMNGCNYNTITNINGFAEFCSELRTVDLSTINFKIKYANMAFYRCVNLAEIKGVLEFDPSLKVVRTNNQYEDYENGSLAKMFENCGNLTGLKVKNIPENNQDAFEAITGLRRNQYTIVS